MIAMFNFRASSNKNLSEEETADVKEIGIEKCLVSSGVCVFEHGINLFSWAHILWSGILICLKIRH